MCEVKIYEIIYDYKSKHVHGDIEYKINGNTEITETVRFQKQKIWKQSHFGNKNIGNSRFSETKNMETVRFRKQ